MERTLKPHILFDKRPTHLPPVVPQVVKDPSHDQTDTFKWRRIGKNETKSLIAYTKSILGDSPLPLKRPSL